MNKGDLKVEENIVYWWNGKKWLIRETCETNEQALELFEDLRSR